MADRAISEMAPDCGKPESWRGGSTMIRRAEADARRQELAMRRAMKAQAIATGAPCPECGKRHHPDCLDDQIEEPMDYSPIGAEWKDRALSAERALADREKEGPNWDRVRRTFDDAIAAASPWPGKPGEHRWIAHGLDDGPGMHGYHAVNLREALKLVPDTGDWHGSLRAACEIVLKDHPDAKPNQTAEQMRQRALDDSKPAPDLRRTDG